ncbi:hypothetical protein RJ639_014441 [Escallonia herrerae]|uniref:YqgF/RNase H-like domain-containing protein n=1 Tax=Escallonia herrerae TaxID=1293975 RepID=A0AA89ANK8_9ASTE|nr:hypothetical protein RJ639_014441 [Escallonia herrerae]
MNGAAIATNTNTLFLPINYPQRLTQKSAINSLHLPTNRNCSCKVPVPPIRALSLEEIPPNVHRRKRDASLRAGFSLGVDLGLSRTGLALSKGFSVRPLTVLELRGQKLELRLLDIAEQQEVDEFIIGLPKSSDGKETPQSNKVRSVAGRFAVRAAERIRMYAYQLDMNELVGHVQCKGELEGVGEYTCRMNTVHQLKLWPYDRVVMIFSTEVFNASEILNLFRGLSKSARQGKIDAYAAVVVLERYFSLSGQGIELVLPKQLELQEKLLKGPPEDDDFYSEGSDVEDEVTASRNL